MGASPSAASTLGASVQLPPKPLRGAAGLLFLSEPLLALLSVCLAPLQGANALHPVQADAHRGGLSPLALGAVLQCAVAPESLTLTYTLAQQVLFLSIFAGSSDLLSPDSRAVDRVGTQP